MVLLVLYVEDKGYKLFNIKGDNMSKKLQERVLDLTELYLKRVDKLNPEEKKVILGVLKGLTSEVKKPEPASN